MKKLLVSAFCLIFGAGLVLAPAVASAQSLAEIAAELDATGRFVDGDVSSSTDAAINNANAAGTAYIQLDQADSDADAQNLLNGLLAELSTLGSKYQNIVLYEPGVGAWAASSSTNPSGAIDAARGAFAAANPAEGLDQFINALSGGTTTGAAPGTTVTPSPASSSGGGFPWITLIIIGGLVWAGMRFFNGRKAKAASQREIEADRKEIKEQLKDNADRVIGLGDKVIANGDPELQRIYSEASASYQTVSTEVDGAKTAAQVDALDDQIDTAEWQFEVIEARLEGRRPPAQPVEPTLPPPPNSRSIRESDKPTSRSNSQTAMGQDESVFNGRTTTRQTRRQPQRRQRQRRGGFASSGMGRMLFTLALQFFLGGGMRQSRRTWGRVSGATLGSSQSSGGGIRPPRGF